MKEVLIALHQKPIAYYPIYRDITGSTTGGILLSQLMYWWQKVGGREFYKTDAEIIEETRLSQQELKTAKRALKNLSFVYIKAKGVPAKTFYDINPDGLIQAIQNGEKTQSSLVKSTKLKRLKQPNSVGEFNQSITENTHKNTQENTSEREIALEKPTIEETINQPILTKISDGHQLNDLILTVERYYQANPDAKRMAIETARFSEGVHGIFADELRKLVTEYSSNAVFASNPTKDLHRMMPKWLMKAKEFNRSYSAKNQQQVPVQPYKVPQTRYLIEE